MELHTHVNFRDLQDFCDFPGAQVFQMQRDQRLVPKGKSIDGSEETLHRLLALLCLFATGLFRNGILFVPQFFGKGGIPSLFRLQVSETGVDGDPIDPGAERGSSLEGVEVSPDVYQHLLVRIIPGIPVMDVAAAYPVHPVFVGFQYLFEKGLVVHRIFSSLILIRTTVKCYRKGPGPGPGIDPMPE